MLLETVGGGTVQLSYLRSFTSLDIAGRAFTPKPRGTSIPPPPQESRAHLPSAPLYAGEPNSLLSSLTAGGLLVSQVPPCAFSQLEGKKWALLPGTSGPQRATAPCLQRGTPAGKTFHTPTTEKIGLFSETVGRNGCKVVPCSTRHCNSLVHKGSMDRIKDLFNYWLLLNTFNMKTVYAHLTILSHSPKPPQQDKPLSAFCFLISGTWLIHSKWMRLLAR